MKSYLSSLSLLPLLAASISARAEVAPSEPMFVEVVELLQSDAAPSDLFGEDVAIDGDVAVISGDEFGVGGAYVFERNQGGPNRWGEVTKLTAPGGVFDDNFGVFLDLDGDVIAVGASIAEPQSSGAVYIVERDHDGSEAWRFLKKITAPGGPEAGQAFYIPALSGDTLIVGATGDDEGGSRQGAVFVYERNAGGLNNWGFVQKLKASDAGNEDRLGWSVAIDNDTIVAGNAEEEAYVFERDGTGLWSEVAKLTPSDGGQGDPDRFGEAVAIEGDLIAIGARLHDVEVINAGAVYVYERDFGGFNGWGENAKITRDGAELGEGLGISAAIDGGRIVAGARGVGNGEDEFVGAAFLFEENNGVWIELTSVMASDGGDRDFLGESVDLSGGTLLAGSATHDVHGFNAGSAYIFQSVASPELSVSGACPGEVTLSLTRATPSGIVSVARAANEGAGAVPGGRCEGSELDLANSRLLSTFMVDTNGAKTIQRHAPAHVCGNLLQAVDMTTCGVGNALQLSP